MKHSLFKSLRAELIFYVAVSMFLSVITEFACGVGLYILSTALGISYRGYGKPEAERSNEILYHGGRKTAH